MAPRIAAPNGLALLRRSMSEASWRGQLRQWGAWHGFTLNYHAYRSQRAEYGWPDDVFCRPDPERPRTLFIESKAQGGRLNPPVIIDGRRHPGQKDWLAGLDASGLEAYLFKPSDAELAWSVFHDGPLDAAERRARIAALPDLEPTVIFTDRASGLRVRVARPRKRRA